ncbi:porin [Corynebacterium pacaense]|nr:porin [Corynebacterium pacaense]
MEFLNDWSTLSSTGIVEAVFTLLESAGKWADAVAKLLKLV